MYTHTRWYSSIYMNNLKTQRKAYLNVSSFKSHRQSFRTAEQAELNQKMQKNIHVPLRYPAFPEPTMKVHDLLSHMTFFSFGEHWMKEF